MASALLFANYDYWGYYNICFLGEEVRGPERTIPRAILISIGLVAVLYLMMNVGLLGVVDWHTFVAQNIPGYVFTTYLNSGLYDLKLVDEDGDVCEVYRVSVSGATNWRITNSWLLNCERH
jgi:amino acid transporter